MTLRLEPADLGTVRVQIDRPAEAPVRVEISVSRPETLTLMLRDQAQLQRTLDQAGVPQDGRVVTFQLADQDGGAQFRQPDGFSQADTPRHQATDDGQSGDVPADDVAPPANLPVATTWLRAGLDITA